MITLAIWRCGQAPPSPSGTTPHDRAGRVHITMFQHPSPCAPARRLFDPSHKAGSSQAGDGSAQQSADGTRHQNSALHRAILRRQSHPGALHQPGEDIPTAAPGYNPHSARPSRGFVQSGLQ